MNSQTLCVFVGVLELIAHKCRVFIRKPPLLLAFIAVVVLPGTFQSALAQRPGNVDGMNKSVMMRDKPGLKNDVCVGVASGCIKRSDVTGKNINKSTEHGSPSVSSLDGKGDKSSNESDKKPDVLSGNGGNNDVDVVQLVLIVLVSFLPAFWAALQGPTYKPNVLLSGAATATTGNRAPSHRVRSN